MFIVRKGCRLDNGMCVALKCACLPGVLPSEQTTLAFVENRTLGGAPVNSFLWDNEGLDSKLLKLKTYKNALIWLYFVVYIYTKLKSV